MSISGHSGQPGGPAPDYYCPVLHEFDLPDKLRLLRAGGRYLRPDGFIVIADIAFPTTAVRRHGKKKG